MSKQKFVLSFASFCFICNAVFAKISAKLSNMAKELMMSSI